MKSILTACIVFFFCLKTSAQLGETFQPGYILLERGDSMRVLLSSKNTKPALKKVKYRLINGRSKNSFIDIRECRKVAADNGSVAYVVKEVRRDLSYIDLMDQTIANPDSSVTEKIPLRLIHKGKKLSLYHYADARDHFFIYENGYMEELMLKFRYLNEQQKRRTTTNYTPSYQIVQVYLDQMQYYHDFAAGSLEKKTLLSTLYNESSMKRLFMTIDQ